MDVPVLAGMVAAVVFATANLPMVWKAVRTHDVGSYSLGSIAMINGANAVYSLYVFSLPVGPIWLLHSFYLVASAIMLGLCLRQWSRRRPHAGAPADRAPADRAPADQSPRSVSSMRRAGSTGRSGASSRSISSSARSFSA